MDEKNFWLGKQVIITGAGGFIGSHLVNFLAQNGAHVVGISRSKTNRMNFMQVDVSERAQLERVFHDSIYACFHLAGQSLVEEGHSNPYESYRNNILSALNILELCRLHKVKRIVIASSVHVYGNAKVPYREEDLPRPSRPYETSKTCVDLIAQSYADSYYLPVVIPRFANIYGPGDLNFTRIIPKTIKSLVLGNHPTIWDGKSKREYLYIDDAVRAYDLIARIPDKKIVGSKVFNFGTGKSVSAEELIQTIIKVFGKDISPLRIKTKRQDEVLNQYVSSKKALTLLGWKPKVLLVEGLKKTIKSYRDFFSASN